MPASSLPPCAWRSSNAAPEELSSSTLIVGCSLPARLTGRSLAQHGLVASMSRKGNCYDNAFIESFWSSLKYEVVYHQRFATFAEARSAIFTYIETFYNRARLHSSLAYLIPVAFESQLNLNQKN
jgi:putative transposase